MIPIGSMYGEFTYVWLLFMVNVGKYIILYIYIYFNLGYDSLIPQCEFLEAWEYLPRFRHPPVIRGSCYMPHLNPFDMLFLFKLPRCLNLFLIFCRLFKCFFPTDLSKKGVNTADSNPKHKKIQRHFGENTMKKHVGYQVSSSQRNPPKKMLVSKTSHGFEDLDPTEIAFKNLNPPKRKTHLLVHSWFI